MTTELKQNKRNQTAMDVLKAGGRFVSALRPDFRGVEKQKYWLVDAAGVTVKGVGFATWYEFNQVGALRPDMSVWFGSTCRQEWTL